MTEHLLKIYVPSELAEIEVMVCHEKVKDPILCAGSYERKWDGACTRLTLTMQDEMLNVRYDFRGGATDVEFDYFNPYIEKGILYCEKNEFAFVSIRYTLMGKEITRKGLLESDSYFYEKLP